MFLNSAFCTDERLQVQMDMDGIVIMLNSFSAIRLPLTFVGMRKRITHSRDTLRKTLHSSRFKFELQLSQVGEHRILLMSSEFGVLSNFADAFRRACQVLVPEDVCRTTVLTNNLRGDFLKVNYKDVLWVLSAMDRAVDELRKRFPDVSMH